MPPGYFLGEVYASRVPPGWGYNTWVLYWVRL